MNNKFITGCNYWASHAGTDMWKNWDERIVEDDIKTLSENGIKFLRVFPNWSDFQPVHPVLGCEGSLITYRFENGETPDNPYYLSRIMLNRFDKFCLICKKYNVRLIVGLITGWMSGNLLIPPVLYGKNLISDPVALYFESLFIKGFIKEFKDNSQIYAWDHGNECSCLSPAESYESASVWTALISSVIKAEDSSRPLISGIHQLSAEKEHGKWTIENQAEHTDMLVTHPYPFWSDHACFDKVTDIRVILYPAALSKFYSEIGKKPCFVEEIGTMGNSVCDDKISAEYLKTQLYSAWENSFEGLMWWCAHEQTNLNNLPYAWNMCEVELGMLNSNKNSKPVLDVMRSFNTFLNELDFDLPKANGDALCISTYGQDQTGISYMSYVLARQAGINIDFEFCDNELGGYKNYILPAYNGNNVMFKENYVKLLEKVNNGANLYISYDGGILSEFEKLTGLIIEYTEKGQFCGKTEINGKEIKYSQNNRIKIKSANAEVLAVDDKNMPVLTKYKYGHGYVYFSAFSPEALLLERKIPFSGNECEIYKKVFSETIKELPLKSADSNAYITYHYDNDKLYCVVNNYSDTEITLDFEVSPDYKITKIYNDKQNKCAPYEAVIVKLERR